MNGFFIALGVSHVALVALLLRRWSVLSANLQRGVAIVVGVGVALAYDNIVIGLGAGMGEGDLLLNLNRLRFLLHVVLTPLMIIAAVVYGQIGGIEWARRITMPAQVLTVFMIALGALTEGLWPDLEPTLVDGVLRYILPDPLIPLPAIVAVVSALVVGGTLWRREVVPWMLVGSAIMFLGSAAPQGDIPIVGNLAEVAFIAGLVATGLALAKLPAGHDPAPVSGL